MNDDDPKPLLERAQAVMPLINRGHVDCALALSYVIWPTDDDLPHPDALERVVAMARAKRKAA